MKKLSVSLLSRVGVIPLMLLLSGCFAQQVQQPEASPMKYIKSMQLIDKGVLAMRQGDLEQAEAAYKMSFELYPQPAALEGLGCLALNKGEVDVAQQLFVKALELNPKSGSAMGNLAVVRERQGAVDEALKLYQQAIALDPAIVRNRVNYAVLLSEQSEGDPGILKVALRELRKASALEHDIMIDNNIKAIERRLKNG